MNRTVKLYSMLNEVDSLQVKLLEKLEQSLGDIHLKTNDIENVFMESNDPKQGKVSGSVHITAHEQTPENKVAKVVSESVEVPVVTPAFNCVVPDNATNNADGSGIAINGLVGVANDDQGGCHNNAVGSPCNPLDPA
ncbi:hypothetical protein V6N13_090584 [Hibiscus sabdariffa]|uniref:Uncharacterized protein n=1 Tax=Hibiscus sabdariffa TaxID=183260 RepID=A0ABR2NXN9_9ROSI